MGKIDKTHVRKHVGQNRLCKECGQSFLPRGPRAKLCPDCRYVRIPVKLIRCGDFITATAVRLFAVIISYGEDAFPSYRKLQQDTGFGSERLSTAIEELITKNIIECVSGQAERKANRYRRRPQNEWSLLNRSHTSVQKRQRSSASIIEEDRSRRCFDNRRVSASIIEDEAASIIEKELDPSNIDPFTSDDAARHRIRAHIAQLNTKLDEIDRVQKRKKRREREQLVGGEKSKIHAEA